MEIKTVNDKYALQKSSLQFKKTNPIIITILLPVNYKSPYTMKRILITGAAGFLGSHLCDRFIKEGYFVIGMDNLITGDLKNIEHLFKLENFEFYHHDILDSFMSR
jgi:hypothetical protein